MNVKTKALVLAASMTVLSLPAGAATIVHVSLIGEEGGGMSIKADRPAVPAGDVVFAVTNDAVGTAHELLVVRLVSKDQALVVDPARHRIDEKKVKVVGEVSDLKPRASRKLPLKLAAGEYRLVCNVHGHVDAGMTIPLSVEAK